MAGTPGPRSQVVQTRASAGTTRATPARLTCAAAFAKTSSGVKVRSVYSGDGNFDGSTSASLHPGGELSIDDNLCRPCAPSTRSRDRAFTANATLSITAPGSDGTGTPTGTVDFQYSTNDGDTWTNISGCTAQSLSLELGDHTGTASCSTSVRCVVLAGRCPGDLFGRSEFQPVDLSELQPRQSPRPESRPRSMTATPGTFGVRTVGRPERVASRLVTRLRHPGRGLRDGRLPVLHHGGDTWNAISDCATQHLTWNLGTSHRLCDVCHARSLRLLRGSRSTPSTPETQASRVRLRRPLPQTVSRPRLPPDRHILPTLQSTGRWSQWRPR